MLLHMSIPKPIPASKYFGPGEVPETAPRIRRCGLAEGASHDDMCVWLLARLPRLCSLVGLDGETPSSVEVECSLEGRLEGLWADLVLRFDSDLAVLVEVKSSHEQFSAGGVIRQLKAYRKCLLSSGVEVVVPVLVSDQVQQSWHMHRWSLLAHAGLKHILCPEDFDPIPG
jgi:hypothetical protein